MNRIKILVCDGDPLFRDSIADLIGKEPDFEVVGIVGYRHQLVSAIRSLAIDVIVLELATSDLYGFNGLEAAIEVKAARPELPIIIISNIEDEDMIWHAFGFGKATNFIVKQHYMDVPQAIREVGKGTASVHHSVSSKLLKRMLQSFRVGLKDRLTPLQLDILKRLADGQSTKEMAEALFYNEQTIYNELSKAAKLFRTEFPYVEWLQLRKQRSGQLAEFAGQLGLLDA
ncbi:DNA-binding response regulator [Paenibacillus psychroresistens]|uniref:DNA-binding response regulator n=1 Tax=Paenibacillus psychroresistens TaxID=1778678 RepID=A0A6B8RT79_9BACL|nr:response regulator transcription factor [Paenibacillus psychroresistens]QGQ99680.1 DNA-binding response regulator [Paenibacillus psychroresistens]